MREVYRTRSAFGELMVREDRRCRQLLLNGTLQGAMYLDDPYSGPTGYPRYFLLGPVLTGPPGRVLFLGLGAGEGIRCFHHAYPHCRIEVAELDPEVVRVAREYFTLPAGPQVEVTVAEGREYVARAGGGYDLIFLDAYAGDAIPYGLVTVEFLRLVRERLKPGGMAVCTLPAVRWQGS